jgi:hypothetical protein
LDPCLALPMGNARRRCPASLAPRDINEIWRRDEILQAGLDSKVILQVQDEGMTLRIIEPRYRINIDDHDMPPIGRRTVPRRPIDAVRGPQQIGHSWAQGVY